MNHYIKAWQELMVEPYPWVLFENGTCVIIMKHDEDRKQQAIQLLKGLYVKAGYEFGDYGVQKLSNEKGWIVTSTHPDVVTLVTLDEVPEQYREDTLSIGSHAQKKRKMDAEACKVIYIADETILEKVISGGQTGADRAGLDVAMKHGIVTGGWCPAGRRAEDGIIPDCYQLTETTSKKYDLRTKWNVRDSDGTLALNLGDLDGGTLETVEYAARFNKPCKVVQLDEVVNPEPHEVNVWLKANSIRVLNVAGPRESKRPGIYQGSYDYLEQLFSKLRS